MAQNPNTPNNTDNSFEALKQYGGYIVMVIVVVLGGYFGWNYWQNHHAKVDVTASEEYATVQELHESVNQILQNPKLSDEAKKTLSENQQLLSKDIDKLIANHDDTIYSWLALMLKARQQADENDFVGANATLKQALALDLHDAGLKAMTQLRYGQSLLASGNDNEALHIVKQEMPSGFKASQQELLGDIYLAKKDKDKAILAYKNAWELLRKRQESRAILALKMESLGMNFEPIEPEQSLIATQPTANLPINTAQDEDLSTTETDDVDGVSDDNRDDGDAVDVDKESGSNTEASIEK